MGGCPRTAARELEQLLTAIRAAQPTISGLGTRGDRVLGKFYGAYVATVFQPWREAATGAVVAFKAYARSHSKDGSDLSPWRLFADAAVDSDLVTLDRLCRTVHAINYFSHSDVDLPLVLNVDARLLRAVPERHGEFFGKILAVLGVAPERVVIEMHATHWLDLSCLKRVLASYRRQGFAVAINAESFVNARSLANVLVPDLLMLPASSFSRDTLPRQVASLHEAGVRIAVKYVETEDTCASCVAAGIDWLQGFHLGSPSGTLAAYSADPVEAERATGALGIPT